MQTTTISQLGNSNAVILPSPILKEAKWKRGEKVSVEYINQADGVFIRRVKKSNSPQKRSEKEFQAWLNSFLNEDALLLDELAHR